MPPSKEHDHGSSRHAGEGKEPPSRAGLAEAIDALLLRIDAGTVSVADGGREIQSSFGAEAINRALDQLYRHPFVTHCERLLDGDLLVEERDPLEVDAMLALLQGTMKACGEPFGYEHGDVVSGETIERLRAARVVLSQEPERPASTDREVQWQRDPHVGLDEAAALAGLSKKTLERMKKAGKLPPPVRPGGGGRAALWRWSDLRPAIEPIARTELPERFPILPEDKNGD